MPWPFDRKYMQLALAAGLVVGACAPMIGAFLVPKRLSLMGDGIGQLAFAGVAAGLVLQVAPVWIAPIVVVAAMRVVGVLLVAALMVLPVGASQQLARSFRGTLALAVGIGVACVILGLAAARLLGLAAGGAIVLVVTATFAVASAAGAIRRRRTRGPRRLEVPTLP